MLKRDISQSLCIIASPFLKYKMYKWVESELIRFTACTSLERSEKGEYAL